MKAAWNSTIITFVNTAGKNPSVCSSEWPISLLNTDNKLLSSILASTGTSFTPINKSRSNRIYSSETAWGQYETNTEYHRYNTETEMTCVNYDWRCSEGFQQGAMALLTVVETLCNFCQVKLSNGCELCTKSQMPESQSIECSGTFFEVPIDICTVYWQTTLGQRGKLKGTHRAGENHTMSM